MNAKISTNSIWIVTIIVAALVTTGCMDVGFEHPLVHPDKAKLPKELFGSYELFETDTGLADFDLPEEFQMDSERMFVHVGRAPNRIPRGFIKMIQIGVAQGEEPVQSEEFLFVSKIGDLFIVHTPAPRYKLTSIDGIVSVEDSEKNEQLQKALFEEWDADQVGTYELYALRPITDGFDVLELNTEFLAAQIKAGNLMGIINQQAQVTRKPRRGRRRKITDLPPKPRIKKNLESSDCYPVYVTAGSAELKTFFKANLDLLFGPAKMRALRIKPVRKPQD